MRCAAGEDLYVKMFVLDLNANLVFISLIIIIISSTLQEMKTTLGSPDPTTWT